MKTQLSRPWGLYLITSSTAMLAGGSAVFWALAIVGTSPSRIPALTPLGSATITDTQILAHALDGGYVSDSPAAPQPPLYQLLGVVAGPLGKGLALLVVGNAPAKAYAVGAALGDGQVLQSVSARGAKIGNTMQGKTTVELSLTTPTGV